VKLNRAEPIRVFLGGDVMTGRGIDQVLPHPGNPVLHEAYVRDARDYVRLAEDAHGSIPRPVDFAYPWGDALTELLRAETDSRIVNLETSITTSEDYWPDKEVLYHVHPRKAGSSNPATCSSPRFTGALIGDTTSLTNKSTSRTASSRKEWTSSTVIPRITSRPSRSTAIA
jgi:hypothetical protein